MIIRQIDRVGLVLLDGYKSEMVGLDKDRVFAALGTTFRSMMVDGKPLNRRIFGTSSHIQTAVVDR
jgi:hypothetical protein